MELDDLDNLALPWPDEGKPSDGLPMARVGLRMAFYFDSGYTRELRAALISIVDEYLAASGGQMRAYQRSGDSRRKSATPAKPVDLGVLRQRVEDFRTSWSLEMSSESDISVASLWSLETVASEDGYLLVHFPVSAFRGAAPHSFRNTFQRWCGALRVTHAYAGLGLALPVGGTVMSAAIKRCGPYATRFVGLDLDYPQTVAFRCHGGIRTVNWLTAIDKTRLEKVGEAARVTRARAPDIQAMDYDGGTIFVAGQAPQIGDASTGQFPEAYAILGRLVAPLRSDIPDAWFKAPDGYEAPAGFTSKAGNRDAEPEQLPALHYTKTWMARFG